MAEWAFWAVMAALGSVAVTGIGVVLVALTLEETREAVREAGRATKAANESVKIAREHGQIQLRAYLSVDVNNMHELITQDVVTAIRHQCAVSITNRGVTPAFDVNPVNLSVSFLSGDVRCLGPLRYKPGHHGGVTVADLLNGDPFMFSFSGGETPIDQKTANGGVIYKGHKLDSLIVGVTVTYRDAFDGGQTQQAWFKTPFPGFATGNPMSRIADPGQDYRCTQSEQPKPAAPGLGAFAT